MRKVPVSLVAIVALAASTVPSLASASGTATVPTRYLAAKGGTVNWSVTVNNAKTCSWSSSPKVPGFATTVRCKSGRIERSVKFGANPLTKAEDYALSLTVRGKTTTVDHLKVVEAPQIITTTMTTTTDPPTTTTAPSTTATTSTTTSTTTTTTPSTTTSSTTTTTTTTLPSGQFPGLRTPNWSGYVLTGASGGYQAVSAEWTVPAVECASVPNGATSDWVGVNGFGASNPGLFQDGTTSYCLNGQQGDYAWWTDEAEGYSSQDVFAVAPGDLVHAQVYQEAAGSWAYYIEDVTNGLQSSALEPFSGAGTSAEWIAEDPGDPTTQGLYPLADFGSVTFTDLGLTVPSGSWTVPPYSDAIEMVGPDGQVETLPGAIRGSSASAAFSVTYEAPGEIDSPAGTVAVEQAQSTFVTPVPRLAPHRQVAQPRSRAIPGPS